MQTLRLFVDVARCRSFSQAAERHGVTQSAASQRVGQLERRLGVTLIDRSVRPLELTEAGAVFLTGCDELLEKYDRLEHQVAAMGGPGDDEADAGPRQRRDVIRVTAIYSAGIDLLNQVSERFEAAHPWLRVDVGYDKPDGVYRAVREGQCDLGILSYPHRWGRVGVLALRDEPMAVVCRPDHPLAEHETVEAEALSGHEMAAFEADLPVGRAIRQYLREHDAAVRVRNEFDNIDTIKAAVAVTEQVSILPKRTVIREVRAGTLVVVKLEPTLVRPMGIIFRPRKRRRGQAGDAADPHDHFREGVRVFVDYLIEHAGPRIDLADQIASDMPETERRQMVGARR